MINVLIYGAGAIGSFVAYLLSGSHKELLPGNERIGREEVKIVENVALLGRKGHMQRILKDGLKIKLLEGLITVRFRHCLSRLSEIEELDFSPDIVIVCVKTHSLPVVLKEIKGSGLLDGELKKAAILLLMNGMGNREMFDLPSHEVFEGITSIGVVFSENGSIELKGKGKTVIESGMDEKLENFLRDRFAQKGFELEISEDFKVHQWSKFFANAVINPITALTREKNGIVLSGHLKSTVERVVEECVAVANKEGLETDKSEALNFIYSVASKTSMNTSSMLQDILKGRKTEIDSINGHLIRLARKHSVPVPANETLYSLVKSMETMLSEEGR